MRCEHWFRLQPTRRSLRWHFWQSSSSICFSIWSWHFCITSCCSFMADNCWAWSERRWVESSNPQDDRRAEKQIWHSYFAQERYISSRLSRLSILWLRGKPHENCIEKLIQIMVKARLFSTVFSVLLKLSRKKWVCVFLCGVGGEQHISIKHNLLRFPNTVIILPVINCEMLHHESLTHCAINTPFLWSKQVQYRYGIVFSSLPK